MWFHLTNIRLYLPNEDTIDNTLHSQAFVDLIIEHGGRASYVLECPDNPTAFTFLTVWDTKADADDFFTSDTYHDFIQKMSPQFIAPPCEHEFEAMTAAEV